MSDVLVTGAASGTLTDHALAVAGHTVHATVRDPDGRNADRASALRDHPPAGLLSTVDAHSSDSADAAVRTILEQSGGIDVAVRNAGHLAVCHGEPFPAEDVDDLSDVNVLASSGSAARSLSHATTTRRHLPELLRRGP